MNTGTLIVGFILVASFIVPIFFISRKNANKNKYFFNYLQDIAREYELKISQSEILNGIYFLAIDNNSNKMLYVKKTADNEEKTVIDLKEVIRCRVDNISRTIKEGKYTTTTVDRIELKISQKNASASEKTIEFFNAHSDNHLILTNELHLAEKWAKIINNKASQ